MSEIAKNKGPNEVSESK